MVSVGDGCTIAGIGKGLVEMKALGFIPRLPRLLGVQAAGARPLVDAFVAGGDLVPGPAETLADSICVGHPRNWRKALLAVRASGGAFVAVPDEAILEAERETGRRAGLFGEPAAAAARGGPAPGGGRRHHRPPGDGPGRPHRQRAQGRARGPAGGGPGRHLPPDDAALDAHLRERPLA